MKFYSPGKCIFLGYCARMSLKYALWYASLFGSLVLSKPLESIAFQTIQLPTANYSGAQDGSDMTHIWSDNSASFNATVAKDAIVKCDGASYGFDLDVDDCELAKAYVMRGAEQMLWAERNTGWQKKIVPLPYRAMGVQATCYVQAVLIDGAPSAKASLNDIRNAAAAIRGTCYSNGKLQGGIATNIGE